MHFLPITVANYNTVRLKAPFRKLNLQRLRHCATAAGLIMRKDLRWTYTYHRKNASHHVNFGQPCCLISRLHQSSKIYHCGQTEKQEKEGSHRNSSWKGKVQSLILDFWRKSLFGLFLKFLLERIFCWKPCEKIQWQSYYKMLSKLLGCIGSLYKLVHKTGRFSVFIFAIFFSF